jgi:hypothetical protein
MKGQIFALSETFVKILSVASLAVVLMAIFFSINQYHLIYLENKADRETLVVGSTVMSSCIAETSNGEPVKGLLSEENIIPLKDVKNKNIECLKYGISSQVIGGAIIPADYVEHERGIYIEIYEGSNPKLLYAFGNSGVCQKLEDATGVCRVKETTTFTVFPAALKRSSGIIPVNVIIYVGV